MASGGFFSSDLYSLYHVVQNTQILYPKEVVISALRNYFSHDSKYHYTKDPWGFPKTPDHTDLPPNAGANDDTTTRLYIGQEQRFDVSFLPAILVKHTGSTFVPISINEEKECVLYTFQEFIDGYNQHHSIQVPSAFIFAGAWDISLAIDILTEGAQDRSTLAEAVSILFASIDRDNLTRDGLFIKSVKTDSETSEIYQNEPVYKTTISLECRGEYRRLIPITSIIEVVNLCIEFGDITNNNPDPNLQINYVYDLSDAVMQASP